MSFLRDNLVVLVPVLVLGACKIHRLPALPPERDPVAADAPVTDYEPPPDVLTTELSGEADGKADPHAGHNHGAAPTPEPATAPAKGTKATRATTLVHRETTGARPRPRDAVCVRRRAIDKAHREASKLAAERIGARVAWDQGSPEDAKVQKRVDAALAKELTADAAVEIALLRNPQLLATFEDIGIAQADLVQGGLIDNLPGYMPMMETGMGHSTRWGARRTRCR